MKKQIVKQNAMQLVGIQIQTNNKNEMNPNTARILGCYTRYFGEKLFEKIQNRKNPGVTYGVYTDFLGDKGKEKEKNYNFFLGEEVFAEASVPVGMVTCQIAKQSYAKLTFGPGKIPQVVIQAWQDIWQMGSQELGGERSYLTDFEVYDERAQDLENTTLDIYLGLKSA